MLELLDAWYTHPDLRTDNDNGIVDYIQTVFRGEMFPELIKLRSYYETPETNRLSAIVCTGALDVRFTQILTDLKENYPYPALIPHNLIKWSEFVESLKRKIKLMQHNNIDIAIEILKHDDTELTMESIEQLRLKIKGMAIEDLYKHGLLKALERKVKWQNEQTTSYKRPGDSLSELHAQIEKDHPPRLILNKPDSIAPNVITITPSFASNSATLYHTFEGKQSIANFDVYKDATVKGIPLQINTEGGLKHAISFRYRPGDLSVGIHVFQLETFPKKKRSEELKITVGANPTLTADKMTLKTNETLAITPSFPSNSATLYITLPSKELIIANSDVDSSAIDKVGELKSALKFEYKPGHLPPGIYVFQLEDFKTKLKSAPLIITVEATEAGAGAARPAEIEAATRPAATARPAAAAAAAEARPAETETVAGAAAAAEARPEAEAGAGAAATAAESKPGWFTSLANRFRSSEKFSNKIKNKIDLLTQKFKILEKTGHSTFESNNDNRIMLQLKKTITGDIDTLVHINNTLNGLLLKYNIR